MRIVVATMLMGLSCGRMAQEQSGAVIDSRGVGGEDCAGILPPGLPDSRRTVTPHESYEVCGYVTVDGAGNLASEAARPNFPEGRWRVVTRDAVPLGAFRAGLDLIPQPNGFQGLYWRDFPPGSAAHAQWDADGTRRNEVAVSNDSGDPRSERVITGGSSVMNNGYETIGSGYRLSRWRFDADGQVVAAALDFLRHSPEAVGGSIGMA